MQAPDSAVDLLEEDEEEEVEVEIEVDDDSDVGEDEEPPPRLPNNNAMAAYTTRDLPGHRRRVCTLAWSPDGSRLASGSADQTIRIWTIEPHNEVARPERADVELKGHTGAVAHVAWKPGSDSVLASTTAGDKSDKSIRFWDVKTGKNVSSIATPGGNLCVTWSPDGSSLAAINTDNTLSLVDVRKPKVFKTHKFAQETYEVLWGPSAQQLLVATDGGRVDAVSLPHMDAVWSLQSHTPGAATYCMAMSHDAKYLASGGGDARVALWDIDRISCVQTFNIMDDPVRSVSLSGDGRLLAYATEGGMLDAVDTESGDLLAVLQLRAQFCDSVAWCPTCDVLAYCDESPDPAPSRERTSALGVVVVYAPPKGQSTLIVTPNSDSDM